jgi:hypothetical protein
MANNQPFKIGINNTVTLVNNGGFSFTGPWKQLHPDTVVEKWHLGDFSSAEFTISVDYDNTHKELVKCLVTAGVDVANVVIYARSNFGVDLIELSATVNQSFVELKASPSSDTYAGAKFIHTGMFFGNQVPLTP